MSIMFGIVCPVGIVATDVFDDLDSCMEIGLGKLSMGGVSTERKVNRRGRDKKMKEVGRSLYLKALRKPSPSIPTGFLCHSPFSQWSPSAIRRIYLPRNGHLANTRA